MRKQDGFTMPGTIIFLVLLTSFFIYETNMLLIDKKFYIEIEQKFVLEEILNRSITNIKRLTAKRKGRYFFFSYEKGEASGNYVFENDVILVSLQCKIKQEIFYKVSFRYRKRMRKYLIG